jgi:FMNH2-dependent dimethyl sulfone monooxygenase
MNDVQPQLTGALGSPNTLKLGLFSLNLEHGGTVSSAPGLLPMEWGEIERLAKQADQMGLETMVPVARWRGFGGVTNFGGPSFETLSWAIGLVAATERMYVFATCHVPVVHPILAANQLVTADHISNGRIGLNVVGGWHRDEIEMFGVPLLEHDARYEMADEWVEIVRRLWMETAEFDFKGDYFDLKRLYCEPKPLQTPRPPIMNAGTSPRGQRFAAMNGDIAYILMRDVDDLEAARATVNGYRNLARDEFDRSLQVWTAATIICRDSAQEARDYERFVNEEMADNEATDGMLKMMGIETHSFPDGGDALRRRFIGGWGGMPLTGTPDEIVDGLKFISDAGCDGCLLMFPAWDEGLDALEDRILPRLEQAGLREAFSLANDPVRG